MSHQKENLQLSYVQKVEGLYIYLSVLFRHNLKNSIKIHRCFIDPNNEKFKNNLKNI
jgi:hypothetical protein